MGWPVPFLAIPNNSQKIVKRYAVLSIWVWPNSAVIRFISGGSSSDYCRCKQVWKYQDLLCPGECLEISTTNSEEWLEISTTNYHEWLGISAANYILSWMVENINLTFYHITLEVLATILTSCHKLEISPMVLLQCLEVLVLDSYFMSWTLGNQVWYWMVS